MARGLLSCMLVLLDIGPIGQGATFRFFIQASVVLSSKVAHVNALDVPPPLEERVDEPLQSV